MGCMKKVHHIIHASSRCFCRRWRSSTIAPFSHVAIVSVVGVRIGVGVILSIGHRSWCTCGLVEWLSFNRLSWSMWLSKKSRKKCWMRMLYETHVVSLLLNAVSTLHIILDIPDMFLSHGIRELFHKSSWFTWKLVQLAEVVLLVFAGAQIYHHSHHCFFFTILFPSLSVAWHCWFDRYKVILMTVYTYICIVTII